ncbi:MAG: hypothetical protein H6631_20600 [Anaerolineaceae bacterium]|nr:hypothetical protein [Anaerolineaceae bacterium]
MSKSKELKTADASKSLATQSAPAGTTIHPEGEPQDIITRPPYIDNAATIARRRLKSASDARTRLINALTLVSLEGGRDG